MAKAQLTNKCCYCDRKFSKTIIRSVEHIIPRSFGGSNDLNNLIYACKECNSLRQNMSFLDFRNMIKSLLNNNRVIKLRSYTREDIQNILNNLENQLCQYQ